jgi:outer membrane biosynthesis protein TonB
VAALILVVIAVAGVVAALSRPPSELDVAAITDDPLTPTNEATGFVVVPNESNEATTEPTSTDRGAPTPEPVVTDRPGGGGPQPPGPGANPKPTPKPTPKPPPPPTPTPTPPSPPTPEPTCLVPNFINTQAANALQKWTGAGFTGPLTIAPTPPPNYQIGWQSLAAGTMAPCTSGITVREVAP